MSRYKGKILIACEESQVVCKVFRQLGYEAYSNDLEDCSGGYPEWHIKHDAIDTLYSDKWLAVIAFPPCTHLAVSGAVWFEQKRKDGRQKQGIDFFMKFANYNGWDNNGCYIAIENPVGIMSTVFRKPDQIIQPWQFGHGETKATCLWLKGLPKLIPTNIVSGRDNRIHRIGPSKDRAKIRSKTYPGIAEAMGNQWGEFLKNNKN